MCLMINSKNFGKFQTGHKEHELAIVLDFSQFYSIYIVFYKPSKFIEMHRILSIFIFLLLNHYPINFTFLIIDWNRLKLISLFLFLSFPRPLNFTEFKIDRIWSESIELKIHRIYSSNIMILIDFQRFFTSPSSTN